MYQSFYEQICKFCIGKYAEYDKAENPKDSIKARFKEDKKSVLQSIGQRFEKIFNKITDANLKISVFKLANELTELKIDVVDTVKIFGVQMYE